MVASVEPEPERRQKTASYRAVRWWPFGIICLLTAVAFIWVRSFNWPQRQDQNVATAIVLLSSIVLLLLASLLFLSGLRWRIRLTLFGSFLGLLAVLAGVFRFQGVTGDLVPILKLRGISQNLPLASSAPGPMSEPQRIRAQLTNDYPQFLGPNRNATLQQPRLARDWSADPPQRLWSQPLGPAWSGFAIAGNRAITQEQRGENEAVVCYDLLSGKVLWLHAYPAHFVSALAGEGPRATPTIANGRVYTLGSTGILTCLELEKGNLIWSKDILQDNNAELNEWGMSCSPLVINDLVVVSAGGRKERSLVAYKQGNGDFAWGGGTDGAGYSSPCPATLVGLPQILIFNSGGVSAHATADGKLLWKYRWQGGHPHVSTPIVLPGDKVLVSSGYGVGSELLQIQKDLAGKLHASRIWKSTRLKAKFTNLVYRAGFIYGLNDGILVCLDAATGELQWQGERYGHGQEILVGELLLITAESGEVVLLEPNPKEARELSRLSAFNIKTWNPPALAGEYLMVRNDKEAACFRLPVEH